MSVETVGGYEFRTLKKTVPDVENEWKECTFYRTSIAHDRQKLREWCRNRFGEPKYQGDYWVVYSFIILSEKAFMLWKLST